MSDTMIVRTDTQTERKQIANLPEPPAIPDTLNIGSNSVYLLRRMAQLTNVEPETILNCLIKDGARHIGIG